MADDKEQNLTEYRPSLAEQKLLDVLLDPANRLKTVTEICKLADVSRQTYYVSFANPAFVAHMKAESARLVERHIPQVVSAFVKQAQAGSYQHGLVLLQMAELYNNKQRLELTGKDGVPLGGILPKDEVEAQLRAMGLLPSVAEKGEKQPEPPN